VRKKRRALGLPGSLTAGACATPEEAVIAMSDTPALSKAVEGSPKDLPKDIGAAPDRSNTIDTARLRRD